MCVPGVEELVEAVTAGSPRSLKHAHHTLRRQQTEFLDNLTVQISIAFKDQIFLVVLFKNRNA